MILDQTAPENTYLLTFFCGMISLLVLSRAWRSINKKIAVESAPPVMVIDPIVSGAFYLGKYVKTDKITFRVKDNAIVKIFSLKPHDDASRTRVLTCSHDLYDHEWTCRSSVWDGGEEMYDDEIDELGRNKFSELRFKEMLDVNADDRGILSVEIRQETTCYLMDHGDKDKRLLCDLVDV